jgi:undecaprenyl diphosphate synthase
VGTRAHTVEQPVLRHILVVGGTVAEWGALSPERWAERIDTLGDVAAGAHATWLTLRPFERGAGVDTARPVHHEVIDRHGCAVIVDPSADGRERLVVTLRKLAETNQLTEASVASALLAPAAAEPDLVLVLGDGTRLPESLVWELAYSELVYLPVAWADLEPAHLLSAIDAFHHRHRRFGGID